MPLADLFAALAVITIWGLNFVVIKLGLRDVPPLLLGALRFALVAFPALLIVPRPRIPWRLLLGYALTISFGQFAFLFSAIHVGMPAGLASLVLQVQAFFTLALAAIIFGDRLQRHNFAGLAIAFIGLAVLAFANGSGADIPAIAFLLTIAAAASWATGNIVAKKIGATDLVGLVVWSALVPILPFLVASYLIEGPERMMVALTHPTWAAGGAIAYLAFAATLVGYSLWGRLLSRHPTWKIAPLTLLVPVLGLSSAWVLLDEALGPQQIVGALTILAGLLVNVFGQRWLGRRTAPP